MTSKIDDIIKQIFELQMNEFYVFLKRLQETLIKHNQDLESWKFK